jgi:pimeloyl-ACP methyl ester carboxylesterase
VAPTVDALADALVAWWVGLGLDRPHVAGNSLGGGIALELARRGVVASATALSPIGFWSRAENAYSTVILHASRRGARLFQPHLRRTVRSRAGHALALSVYYGRPARRAPTAAAADVAGLAEAPGFEATLPHVSAYRFRDGDELRVPVTIGWGTRDALLLPWQADRARAALPRARHVPLPGCGHVPMSDDPAGVAALLLTASATA